MGVKKRNLLILVLLAVIGSLSWWKRDDMMGIFKAENTVALVPYENRDGKFSFSIPMKWKVDEASSEGKFLSRTLINPVQGGVEMGNIAQLSVTIVASPGAGQPFSKQSEFDEWWNKGTEEIKGTGIIKLGNEQVAGEKAIRLAEVDIVEENIDQSFWSVTTWFRHNELNYYINMMGNGSLTEKELKSLDRMLSAFKFN